MHYDEFTALRKPQLTLRVAPNYYRLVSDLSRDYVYLRNYDNLSAAASVTLSQKMLNWGGEAYIGTQAIWTEYLKSDKDYARQFMAAPILVGYRQTLLGYNPYRWEKAVEDQRLKAARQQHQYDMNTIAEEVTRRFFRLICAQGQADMYQRNLQAADTLYAIGADGSANSDANLLRSEVPAFMGGDQLLVKVKTSTNNHRRLMLIKDSFGNALPAFLFYSFEEIHVVDFRYFNQNIQKYVSDNNITDILFEQNIFNAYSPSIYKLLEKFLNQ